MYFKLFLALYDGDATPEPEPKPVETFTQEQVNSFNKKANDAAKAAKTEAEELRALNADLQNQQTMSSEEKEELQKRIKAFEDRDLSEAEKTARAVKKAQEDHETELTSAKENGQKWQKLFSTNRIESSIRKEASSGANPASNADQFVDLLAHRTELVAVKNDDGNETGEFSPIVKGFRLIDEKGEEHSVDLTVTETIGHMREMEKYSNLFKDGSVPGTGQKKTKGRIPGKEKLTKDMTAKEYRDRRKAGTLPK